MNESFRGAPTLAPKDTVCADASSDKIVLKIAAAATFRTFWAFNVSTDTSSNARDLSPAHQLDEAGPSFGRGITTCLHLLTNETSLTSRLIPELLIPSDRSDRLSEIRVIPKPDKWSQL